MHSIFYSRSRRCFFLARFFKLENLACIVNHFPIKTCLFKSNLLLSLYHKKFAKSLMQISQINNNTDRTLDVVFSKFKGFSVHNNPEAEVQRSYAHALSLSCYSTRHAHNSFGIRVIVTKNPLNLEKTTSSVLSVFLLIYGKCQTLHILEILLILTRICLPSKFGSSKVL